jgi:NAD(P)-dependent dehydrogenase (short-subunit alcohol dehydrogenase family)
MANNQQVLNGKVAIVTGSGGGIGAATARMLAEQGAAVIIAGPPETGIEATAEALVTAGYSAQHCQVDISSEDSVKALLDFTRQQFGRLDILDNNAAYQPPQVDTDVVNMDVEVWDRIHAVNGRGTMLMCKHAIPLMIEGGGGSIINISSGTSSAGDFSYTAYASSKGAINTLTKYVATQYGAQGIRCNAIAVGLVNTPALQAGMPPVFQQEFAAHKLVGRIGEPNDVASMVCFLASDSSSWVSGQLYPVDGGFYAHTPTTVGVARLAQQLQAGDPEA